MIADPVIYCAEDLALVREFAALDSKMQCADYWSRPSLEQLRSRVKAFYIEAQKTRCCYCNRHLATDHHRMWDVEHVASRVGYPRFMFEPRNMAASCPDCNILKGDTEVLVSRRRKTYPKTSAGFLIVHPHFDRYEDHIFHRGMVYFGKTKKGTSTIYVCDLLRFAQKFIDWENSATDIRFEKEVEAALDGNTRTSQAAVEAIVAQLPVKR
jgi:hypothetical protein